MATKRRKLTKRDLEWIRTTLASERVAAPLKRRYGRPYPEGLKIRKGAAMRTFEALLDALILVKG